MTLGQVSSKLRRATGGYMAWCPGCLDMHLHPDAWEFDGNLEAPTFRPSFRHSWKIRNPAGGDPIDQVCHYILTAGVMEFCADSTHALAGQRVPLPDLLPEHRDA